MTVRRNKGEKGSTGANGTSDWTVWFYYSYWEIAALFPILIFMPLPNLNKQTNKIKSGVSVLHVLVFPKSLNAFITVW